jgi:lipoate-protein ligase B
VTHHGLALNVDCDLGWARIAIVPCGIKGRPVGTLAAVAEAARVRAGRGPGQGEAPLPAVSVATSKRWLLAAFEDVFGCRCQ